MMFYQDKKNAPNYFDVVICGGGLAGLTLARQLRMNHPELSIAVLERTKRPLPIACLKVGESSVEVGTNYFTNDLDLLPYFEKKHVPKLGLRFFFGDSRGPIEKRPEVGADRFPEVPSFQIDRGMFENDLREMVAAADVNLFEDWSVKDIQISETEAPHRVQVQRPGSKSTEELECRWVVDATGRRRTLQKKLGLMRENGHQASAAWFRMEGRLDIDDLVPASRKGWHSRVPNRIRWYSTNHLMGPGYWVWLIPLGSGNTSVGIVTSETMHPVRTYNTYELAYQWLRKHEPRLARYLGNKRPLDFLCYKNYSYSSHQVISHERWACVGEAGVFTDPFYSPGSDFICMGNTMVNELVRMDAEGTLTRDLVEDVNALYLSLNDSYVDIYRGSYDIFGMTHIMAAKIVFDWSIYWEFLGQLCFQNMLARPEFVRPVFEVGRQYVEINQRVQQLFRDWGNRATNRDTFDFLNPFDVPFCHEAHVDLARKKTGEETLERMEKQLPLFEEWGNVLRQRAIEETDDTVTPWTQLGEREMSPGELAQSRMEGEMQCILGASAAAV